MSDDHWPWRVRVCVLAGLALLCALAYLRALALPFISDDYVQIMLGRDYGPPSGWGRLAADPLYRCRATSLVLTWWTERLFGDSPVAFNASSLLVHILNTWLVLALGAWRRIGWKLSVWAAAFFAVSEGHQGAVMWYAALPELLVFLFAMLSLVGWIQFVQAERPRAGWYGLSLAAFLLALASKESAVIVAPLLVAVWWHDGTRSRLRLAAAAPYFVLAAVYALAIYLARASHLFFHDGTFSLAAPFWITLPNSAGRLLWFWGLLALVALAASRISQRPRLLVLAFTWVALALLPYSFLTYMPRVPSRHTYLASVGLALIVAAGWLAFRERSSRRAAVALAVLVVAHNCGYLWTRKQNQYLERAAPTEALIEFARTQPGPVYVHCFPYDFAVAQFAAKVRLNKVAEPAPIGGAPGVFCWDGEGSRPVLAR